MKTMRHIAALCCLMALMVGCKQKTDYPYEVEYLPVQLVGSEKWSILDVRSGELVVKDAYDITPSAVVSGMYYVMNDEGTFDYYNIADPKHPVNKVHYGSVTSFGNNGLAIASHRGGPLEVIDRKGETVATLPKEVAQCAMFCNGLGATSTSVATRSSPLAMLRPMSSATATAHWSSIRIRTMTVPSCSPSSTRWARSCMSARRPSIS